MTGYIFKVSCPARISQIVPQTPHLAQMFSNPVFPHCSFLLGSPQCSGLLCFPPPCEQSLTVFAIPFKHILNQVPSAYAALFQRSKFSQNNFTRLSWQDIIIISRQSSDIYSLFTLFLRGIQDKAFYVLRKNMCTHTLLYESPYLYLDNQ